MRESAGSRVLMLLENNPFQSDVRPRNEAQALARAGYQVSVISPRPARGQNGSGIDGVRLYQFPAPPDARGFLGYVWEYAYATAIMSALSLVVLARDGFDVLHAHNPPDTFFALAALYKLLGKRFVFDHHDLAPEMYIVRPGHLNWGHRLVFRALSMLESLTCRLADRVIATNESYKVIEMSRDRVPAQRITIVRNGPDPNTLRAVTPDPVLRQKAGIILGYVGIMGPHDGVDHLLRSVRRLVFDLGQQDVLCVIIGRGKMVTELKAMAVHLKIQDRIWFTGWISQEDLIRYLSTADICLDPDVSNAFNDRSTMIKMMEYMALGKPIVAFDLPEHRVTARDAAAYAQPNDELDFARQIAALIADPERRERMGRAGRQRIEAELAWAYQEQHLLEAYRALGLRAGNHPHL